MGVHDFPGGSEVALENPDEWAFLHYQCSGCGNRVCDRCVLDRAAPLAEARCPDCGGSYAAPQLEKNARITRQVAEQAWKAKSYDLVHRSLAPLPLFGIDLSAAEAKKLDFCSRKRSGAPADAGAPAGDGKRSWWQFWR